MIQISRHGDIRDYTFHCILEIKTEKEVAAWIIITTQLNNNNVLQFSNSSKINLSLSSFLHLLFVKPVLCRVEGLGVPSHL